ncbi:response regulator transcription factor [Pseudoflavitalea sp. X16]|uniref:LytR/AlgR family response regulator transcription factor n=1 Tax=Paraflavitalea devenefica TaxID=2716334 RepID=UPI0014219895|nr:LytTR family DNA-binding domain-containing protein [Paraflavitalea devenefica]NII28564.1 response regulator transcription factor [Paraflavitalea devenefica]
MLKCMAVDDEKLVLDLLVDNIQQVPFLQLVKACRNAMEAAAILHEQPVDLIFLDIQMPGLNGLQFLQSLKNPPMAILVTAYKEYALEGFNLDVVDYLLKPVSFERFLKACNKAQDLYNLQQKSATKEEAPDYFFVYVEYVQVKVSIPDILYIEGMKDYVKIFLASSSRPVITKMSMKAIQEKLSAFRFIRTHKSYIVAAGKVTAVKRDLICIGSLELPLSENYKGEVEKALAL